MFVYPRDAACRDVDPELMFPEQVADQPFAPVARAEDAAAGLAVCRACPVLAQCRAGALERAEGFGIFGGFTASERGDILRSRRGTRVKTA